MTHVACRLIANNRNQLRDPTLDNRVWATFTFYFSVKFIFINRLRFDRVMSLWSRFLAHPVHLTEQKRWWVTARAVRPACSSPSLTMSSPRPTFRPSSRHTSPTSRYVYAPHAVRQTASPYSIAERRVPELIPVLGSQPAGDVSHTPGGRLPLLSARPAVTPATLKRAATSFAAW